MSGPLKMVALALRGFWKHNNEKFYIVLLWVDSVVPEFMSLKSSPYCSLSTYYFFYCMFFFFFSFVCIYFSSLICQGFNKVPLGNVRHLSYLPWLTQCEQMAFCSKRKPYQIRSHFIWDEIGNGVSFSCIKMFFFNCLCK